MKMKKIYLFVLLFSSFICAEVYEDAEDGKTNGWIVSSGATVSNVIDDETESRVIKLSSSSYKYYQMKSLDDSATTIKWDIKANSGFIVYIHVTTTEGNRLFYYTISNRDKGVTGSGIHHGLNQEITDGTWNTIERDLESELQESEPDNSIIKINSFKIRSTGDIFLDNIESDGTFSTPTPTPTHTPTQTCIVIKDAEDGATSGWIVSSGARVSNVVDADTDSKVIKLSSSSYKYYQIKNLNNSATKIKWDIKAGSAFIVYILVETTEGNRLFYYTISSRAKGVTSSGIHHGLNQEVTDGTWHTIERDLESELQEFEPDNSILKITSFKIRLTGDVFVDNIIGCDGNDDITPTPTPTEISTPTPTPTETSTPIIIPPVPSTRGVNSVFDLSNKLSDRNPTFEEPFVGSYARSTEHIYHTDVSHTDDGSGSVELRGHGWGKGLRTKPFFCEAHKKYLLSAYIKIKNLDLGQNLFFTIPNIEGGGIYWNVSKEDSWEEILFQFIPKNTGICELYIMTNNRSFSTTKNSNGVPNKVMSSGSNLDRRAKIFIDDLKIVQSNKIIPRERRSAKKVFDSSYIHIDGLGNFTVKEENGWKSIFPKMIYRNSGVKDGDMVQYRPYAEYGFNGIMDIRRKNQVVYGLSVGLKYFGILASNEISELEDGEAFPRDTKELIDYVNNDIGKPYTLLFYNHDNENSALQDYDWHKKLTAFVNRHDKDLFNSLKRARPIYYLNGHAGVARACNNNNRVQMDITGSYVADKVSLKTYIPQPHETLGILDKGQNQIVPVTMIQLQSYLNEKLIPSLFYGIIQGGKGVSIWRDGGSQSKFQNTPWANHIKSIFTKLDQMLPIIREAHWTNWSADVTDKGAMVNIGTRNHNGKGYLILSSHSSTDEYVTINLNGIEASSVEDYFTHQKIADVVNDEFSITMGHDHNGYLVLKLN